MPSRPALPAGARMGARMRALGLVTGLAGLAAGGTLTVVGAGSAAMHVVSPFATTVLGVPPHPPAVTLPAPAQRRGSPSGAVGARRPTSRPASRPPAAPAPAHLVAA